MRNAKFLYFLIILTTTASLITGCSNNEDNNSSTAAVIVTDASESTEQSTISDSIIHDFSNLRSESAMINVDFISQYPELPTGCEITSLATVLNYLGYPVNKVTLAEQYLPTAPATSRNFFTHFGGYPWDSYSWGCFAPAIVEAANSYLTAFGSALTAYNVSYSKVETILNYVADGMPVLIWTTSNSDFENYQVTYEYVDMDNGSQFLWPAYEHCFVLIGYDINAQTVTVSDPMYGIEVHSLEAFENKYNAYYQQAVVIK